jgi:hypothetical protein
MNDKTYLIRFKPPELRTQPVIAVSAEIQGNHLVLFNSEGKLAALFLTKVVESCSEMQSRLTLPAECVSLSRLV